MSKNKTTLVIDNKSFLIYKDFYETAKHLTNEQMGELFHAIFVWQISGEEEAVSPELNLTLKTLISQFKRDGQAYKDRCNKNRENIKKRWESNSKKKIRSNTNVNDSIQTNTKHTDREKDSDKDIGNKYSNEFEEFWEVYPKKVGKGGAYKAWNKSKRPTTDKIIQAVENCKLTDQWRKDGGQFIPNPQTWINDSRWDDDTETEVFIPWHINGRTAEGIELCNGLTRKQHQEKYGRLI